MLSEKLLPPQVSQPIDSENGRPLSKLPPVATQCAWPTITLETGKLVPSCSACAGWRVCRPTEWPAPCQASIWRTVAHCGVEIRHAVDRQHRAAFFAREGVVGA